MSRKFLRVAKVGGSLFDFADLPTALRCWLDNQPGVNVLIAGGGPFADAVRQVDATFAIGESTAHRLSLEAMRVSAELLAALLPEAKVLDSLADVRTQLTLSEVVVFYPSELQNVSGLGPRVSRRHHSRGPLGTRLNEEVNHSRGPDPLACVPGSRLDEEVNAETLPHSWDVTSDSIAAHVATQLQAQELVLFKSTSLPANTNRAEAAASGLVDGYFVEAAATFATVRWVNLRGTPVTERPLR